MTPRLRAPAIALALAAGAAAVAQQPPAASAARDPRPALLDRTSSRRYAEQRYRIIGKVRLAFFWVGRDDVGGARMTWRSDGEATAVSLLVGSDPQRAPRNLNQWAYLREEASAGYAHVFALRSLADEKAPPASALDVAEGPLFGVSCASMTDRRITSAMTIVTAHDLTYRMFARVLDQIAAAPRWQARETLRPAGADAGFLSALQHVIRDDGDPSRRREAATYVYNGTVYDLRVRRTSALGRTRVEARTFERLVRADLAVRNRTTGDVTPFAVTYAPSDDAMPLPVQIFYRPSFWISIELRLDDGADVPDDPAGDQAVLTRIRSICSGSASGRH